MKAKMISLLALFIALSAVGAAIKIPSPVGSVALDAFPAILAGGLLGGGAGAIVGALGHLLSALIAGFPLGPMHLLIAGEMAVLVWLFAIFYNHHKKYTAGILFVLGNTFIAPIPFIFLINKAFYATMILPLLIGSVLNTVIAMVILPRLFSVFPMKNREVHQ